LRKGATSANNFNRVGGVARRRSVGEGSRDAGGVVEDKRGEAPEVEGRREDEDRDVEV